MATSITTVQIIPNRMPTWTAEDEVLELRGISDIAGLETITTANRNTSSGTYTMAQSTADSYVGKVSIKSVDLIPVYDSTGKIISNERASYQFPFAPTDIKFDGLTDAYTELERPGLRPLIRRNTKNPLKMAFTATVVNRQGPGTLSCEEEIALISSIASLNVDLYVQGLGYMASGVRFRITDMAAETKRMNPKQHITIADVSLTFTEVTEVGKVVPGMTLLKDPPKESYTAPSKNHTSKEPNNTEEIDKWTAAKTSVRGT